MTTETPVTPPTQLRRRRTDDILTTLADRIAGRFNASTVFGSPVEREGVTVIPVATVRFGFGGGGGADPSSEQSGEGAGGARSLIARGSASSAPRVSRSPPRGLCGCGAAPARED
jgi:Sporulation protein YtfJ (Spore_YtfJ)